MAEIKNIYKTSIFDTTCKVVVNTVNCMGIMGKGLALEFRLRYPNMYKHYKNICDRNLLSPGKLFLFKESRPWILCFPTKNHWKDPSRIEYIDAGLSKFAETYNERGITDIAFPKLGTVSGMLKWEDVESVMYQHLSPLKNLNIEIYHFSDDSRDSLFDKFIQKVSTYSVGDYMSNIGLRKKEAKILYDAISANVITNMLGLQNLEGFGEKSLNAIYSFLNKELLTQQITLF